MRAKSDPDPDIVPGLMPPSLSAEHFGTVDQYYWDSFWALAGLQALTSTARILGRNDDGVRFDQEAHSLATDLKSSFELHEENAELSLIASTPRRQFDESAIGSIASVYPLQILGELPHPANTVGEIDRRFTDSRGFFHPIIHSGYNPYLTLQLAHSYLYLGDRSRAWELAETIFRQSQPPYSLPEAIHPKTGGGSMGDGHHGWAAAEIVLFLRDCMVREVGNGLLLFGGRNNRLVERGRETRVENAPTDFGPVSVSVQFETDHRCVVEFGNKFFAENRPGFIDLELPFIPRRLASSPPRAIIRSGTADGFSIIHCTPGVKTLFMDL